MARARKRKSTGGRGRKMGAKRGKRRSSSMAAGKKTATRRGKRASSSRGKRGGRKKSGLRKMLSSLPLVS